MITLIFALTLLAPNQLPENHTERWRKGWMGTKGQKVGRKSARLEPAWTGSSPKEQRQNIISQKKNDEFYAAIRNSLTPKKLYATMKRMGWGGKTKKQLYWVTKNMDGAQCHKALKSLGIPYTLGPYKRGMKYPVSLPQKTIGGVYIRWAWGVKKALVFDCRMVLSMYLAAPIFLKYGFDEIIYTSTYRYTRVAGKRRLSRHAHGMAIDIKAMRGPGGKVAVVERDWTRIAGTKANCIGPIPKGIPYTMRALVCELEQYPIFRRILTPDYDHGHRDHFHISGTWPGETWYRRRYAGKPLKRKLSTYYHKKQLPHKLPPRPKFLSKATPAKGKTKFAPPKKIPEEEQSD